MLVPHLLSIKGENCSFNLELPAFPEVAELDATDLSVDPSGPGQVAMRALEFTTSGLRCFIYKLASLGSGGKCIN